ncbi:MAG: hypothetical protein Fur0041_03200 [Bacteroidia bacterium]
MNRHFLDKLRLYIKDVTLQHPYEHIIRPVRFIQKSGIEIKGHYKILDIGAYDGLTALFLNNYFPELDIYAFEPNPEAFKLLRKNTAHSSKIHCIEEAISNEKGSIPFHVTFNKVSSSVNKILSDSLYLNDTLAAQLKIEKTIHVPTNTLDSYNLGEVLLLKMDTQGNETRVISGGRNTLNKTRIIIAEMSIHKIYENGCSYFETDSALRELGFVAIDFIVPSRKNGVVMTEFDAVYINKSYFPGM